MALMPPACVQAGGLAADAAQGVACGQLHIALHGHAGVLAAEQADVGGCDECGRDRRVKVNQGLGKLFRWGQPGCDPWFLASCPLTLPLCLPWACAHGIGMALHGLLGIKAVQGLGALLLCALAQGLAQLLGGFELGHGLSGVHLGAAHWHLCAVRAVVLSSRPCLRARWPSRRCGRRSLRPARRHVGRGLRHRCRCGQ